MSILSLPIENFDEELDLTTLKNTIRYLINEELKAISQYETVAELSSEPFSSTFKDIAAEEKIHMGELLSLLLKLDKEQVQAIKDGFQEVKNNDNFSV